MKWIVKYEMPIMAGLWITTALSIIGLDMIKGNNPFTEAYHYYLTATLMGGVFSARYYRSRFLESKKLYDDAVKDLETFKFDIDERLDKAMMEVIKEKPSDN